MQSTDGDELLTSRRGRFTPGKEPTVPTAKEARSILETAWTFRIQNQLPLPGFKPRTVHLVAYSLYRLVPWGF